MTDQERFIKMLALMDDMTIACQHMNDSIKSLAAIVKILHERIVELEAEGE